MINIESWARSRAVKYVVVKPNDPNPPNCGEGRLWLETAR
jgi:hypothetical protein